MFGLVKPILSTQGLLPVMSGQVGALLPILRAVLVTGAGVANVSTLTVVGGVATATFASAHGYIVGNVVLISGADQVSLNGEARVLSVPSPNIITFATSAADGSGSGSITCRLAPAGWEEVFTGVNVAVFRPTAVGSTRMYMRVDDTVAQYATVRCYEDMTGVNTGTNPIPTDAQMAGGLIWHKSNTMSTAVRHFAVLSDAAGVYFCPAYSDNANLQRPVLFAGKFRSAKAGDAWDWLITGKRSSTVNTESEGNLSWSTGSEKGGVYAARSISETVGPVPLRQRGEAANNAGDCFSGASLYAGLTAFPNPANDALLLSRVELVESGGVRGQMPGLYHIRSNAAGIYTTGQILDAQGVLAGNKLMAVVSGSPYSTSSNSVGVVLFDITDTWSR